mgnify:CR=1 FL=1
MASLGVMYKKDYTIVSKKPEEVFMYCLKRN